jgi:hypothetical protein
MTEHSKESQLSQQMLILQLCYSVAMCVWNIALEDAGIISHDFVE